MPEPDLKLWIQTKNLNFLLTFSAEQWQEMLARAHYHDIPFGSEGFGHIAFAMVHEGNVKTVRATHESREKVFAQLKEHYPNMEVFTPDKGDA